MAIRDCFLWRALVMVAAVGGVLPLLGQGPPAHAATVTVNRTADAVDANPGDGVCETALGNGVCTLRAAIQEANALDDADNIILPAGTYTLTIAGVGEDAAATGDLDIRSDLTITGTGAATTVIDGAGIDRVFDVDPTGAGVTVEISGVAVQNGVARNLSGLASRGGGISNNGTLTVSNSAVRDNTGAQGINDTFGGGIYNAGTLTLTDSTVIGNTANSGGGICNSDGTSTVNRSTVNGNLAGAFGGGLANYGWTAGTVTIENSTISDNSSDYGGGIVQNGLSVTVVSSTLTGNHARYGGGIVAPGLSGFNLKNTIVAENTASLSGGDCYGGGITSAGHNLDSDGSCGLAGAGDLSNVEPLLGPLANNGGPTRTHALLDASPAVDAASRDCPPPATDQRSVARPQGAACDIGAFELEAVASATRTASPTVTATPTASQTAIASATATDSRTPTASLSGGKGGGGCSMAAPGGDSRMTVLIVLALLLVGIRTPRSGVRSKLAERPNKSIHPSRWKDARG